MKLTLVGWMFPTKKIDGYNPNGIIISVDILAEYFRPILHIVYSQNQVREVLVRHSDADVTSGTHIGGCISTMMSSLLPVHSENEYVQITDFCAYDLWQAIDSRQDPDASLPPAKTGLVHISTPTEMNEANPYAVCVVEQGEGHPLVYLIASHEQFVDFVAKHLWTFDYADLAHGMFTLADHDIPDTSSYPAVCIDGYAAQVFAAGFRTLKPSSVAKKIISFGVPRTLIVGEVGSHRMNGIITLQQGDEVTFTIFYSKKQAEILVKNAHDMSVEMKYLEYISESSMPATSNTTVISFTGIEAKILHDAYIAHLRELPTAEEMLDAKNLYSSMLQPLLPKSPEQAHAILAVALNPSEQVIYIVPSKRQMYQLLQHHSTALSASHIVEIKKRVEGCCLPDAALVPIARIEHSVAFALYRGLRMLMKKSLMN